MKTESTPAKRPRTELGKAAATARVTASRYHTRIHVIEGGRIVSLDPTTKLLASPETDEHR